MSISIANKLEVLPGNVIRVPGCEAPTSFTSVTLGVNLKCNNTVVTLQQAIDAIPGATLEVVPNPRRLFLVLPDGPPGPFGCTDTSSVNDHYQALRDIPANDQPLDIPSARPKPCDGFPLKGCF